MRRVLLLLAALLAWPDPARAAADDTLCQTAIAAAERKFAVRHGVLGAIAIVESGRLVGRRMVPWPWTIDVGGAGRVFASKQEAVDAVRALQASGLRSIDVGCMQINLAAHPQAFGSLDDAFDPAINADYAARFLQALFAQNGRLAAAMTAYHSQTPEFAVDYARRLLSVWPGAADLGLTAEPLIPEPPAPPSPYTAHLAQQLEANRSSLSRYAQRPIDNPAPTSRLERTSTRGSAWPTR